jgi:hypothetical protein
VIPFATIFESHSSGAPLAKAASAACAKSGAISMSRGKSVMPQAWIMRTTMRSAPPEKRERSASARIIAKERR